MIYDRIIPVTEDNYVSSMANSPCPNHNVNRVTTGSVLKKIFSIGNSYRSSTYLLKKMVKSSSRPIEAMKITVVIILFPIIIIPLLIMAVIKTVIDMASFPVQRRFLHEITSDKINDAILPPGCKPIHLTVNNNTLIGYDYPHCDTSTLCKGIIVYFPGNGEIAEAAATSKSAKKWQKEGFHCLFASYPGYGGSDGCIQSEEDVYAAGQAFVDYARNLERPMDCPLILVGWSIGSGIAMHLANKNADVIDKVILHAPYCSLRSLVKGAVPECIFSLVRSIIYHIPTDENIIHFTHASPNKKVLMMHAEDDNIIPISQSKKLIGHYKESKLANLRQVTLLKFVRPHRTQPYLKCEDNHKHCITSMSGWHGYLPEEHASFILDPLWEWNKNGVVS